MSTYRKSPLTGLTLFALLFCCASPEAYDYEDGDPSETTVASSKSTDAESADTGAGISAPGQALDRMVAQDIESQDVRDELNVRESKRKLLAENFLGLGDNAFQRGDWAGAALHYADAFQLDPSSTTARDGLRRAQAALTGEGVSLESAFDLAGQHQMRWARERIRIEGLVGSGDKAMVDGDFQIAVTHYRSATMALERSPDLAGGAIGSSLVAAKLDEATEARDGAAAALREAEASAAAADTAAEEEARKLYFENTIRTLFTEADDQFSAGFYKKSISTLDRLLTLDPQNKDALSLRGVANEAWHQQTERNNTADFREQWKRTFEELRTLAVPPRSIIEHDLDYWRNVVDKRKPLDEYAGEEEDDPTVTRIENALETTRIEPRFDNTVEEIADNLAAYTRVNFVISRAVREDLDEDTKTVRMAYNRPMPVSQILRIIEDLTGNEVRFVIRNGVVNVVTTEEANTGQVKGHYEVRDIVRKVQDFPATEINLAPSGGIDEVEEEMPEKEATILTEDELLEAIQETIEPDSWDETGTISIENGTLIVYHRPDVQDRVRKLLEDLRQAANIMVEIKVRFLKVEDSFLQDIGVDFRGLGDDSTSGVPGQGDSYYFDDFGDDPGSTGNPGVLGTGNDAGAYFRESDDNVNILARTENLYDTGLGDEEGLQGSGGFALQYTWLDDTQLEMILRAVEKSQRSEVVTRPKLMVYNTARANLTVSNQVSYVSDFDVEIAASAAIADPMVRVARDGVFLDVRPVVTA
ncbi:MAG TPA: hypothetical protein DDW23_01540, partial [Planctomycetes bacterium]|nr:hypothetical protein [Planctomycetota bacterium]